MNDAILRGIRRRLTLLVIGVVAIAAIDAAFFITHPATDWHECDCRG